MAVPIVITNRRTAQEIVIDDRATQEVAIVSYRYPGVTECRIVARFRPGCKEVKVVGAHFIKNGEVL
jgi:hypothetical protein